MRWSPSRVTSALLPSGENTTWLGPDFSLADRDLAGRRHGRAADGEDRDRPLVAVGHQRQRAGLVDGDAGRALAGLQRGDHLGRGRRPLGHPDRAAEAPDEARLQRRQVDDRHPVVGDLLGGIGRIDAPCGRDERDVLLGRNRHVGRRADHAVGHLDLGQHLGRGGAQVDDGTVSGCGFFCTSTLPSTSLTLASLAEMASCACAAARRCPPTKQRQGSRPDVPLMPISKSAEL